MKRENFIRVHAVDDNPLHRHVLESVCAEIPLISLAAFSAIPLSCDIQPDLILINLNNQHGCVRHSIGLSAVKYPDVPIIGYLNSFDTEILSEYSLITSDLFILMTYQEILLQLREYIRLVQAGEPLSARMMRRESVPETNLTRFMQLSPKEKDVFCLLGKALGPQEIAEVLKCSPRTVETHQRKISQKLKVSGQFELRRFALQLMKSDSCVVLAKADDNHCKIIGHSVGHCPYLKAQ